VQRHPPTASKLSSLFAKMAEASMRIPRSRAWLLVVTALIATITLDIATGPQVNVVVLYLAIACFGSWCLSDKVGLTIGAISVVMLGEVNGFGASRQVSHITHAALAWNMISRSLLMTIMIALAGGVRHSLDQARWSATTDVLTGVLNKAAFQRRLSALIGHAQRRGDSLVLAYLDLDGFKGVNDGFGHAAGDRLLCTFAEQASDTIRAHDLFARVGGDEFVALMTVPTCHQGDIAAERLHHRLSVILRDTGYAVTCSIGAMVVESRGVSSPDALVEAADGLMYEVKRSGKNALRVARLDLQPAIDGVRLPMPDRRQKAAMADAA
jgi:diguanylate cyclase (GGDEF)-like protein